MRLAAELVDRKAGEIQVEFFGLRARDVMSNRSLNSEPESEPEKNTNKMYPFEKVHELAQRVDAGFVLGELCLARSRLAQRGD